MLIKYSEIDKVKGIPMSKNDIDNLKGIMKNKTHVNHSHISGEIIGYAHRYCNYKVRENQKSEKAMGLISLYILLEHVLAVLNIFYLLSIQ